MASSEPAKAAGANSEPADGASTMACATCSASYTNADAGMTVSEAQTDTTWRCGVCLGTHASASGGEKKRKAVSEPVGKPKKPGWRPEEDEELRQLVDKMGTKDWDNMAKAFSFDRPAGGLRNRWFGRLAHPTVGRIEVDEVVDLGGPRGKRESKKIAKFEPGEGPQYMKPERTEEEERELQASKERKRKAREAREAQAAREAEEAAAEAELMKVSATELLFHSTALMIRSIPAVSKRPF